MSTKGYRYYYRSRVPEPQPTPQPATPPAPVAPSLPRPGMGQPIAQTVPQPVVQPTPQPAVQPVVQVSNKPAITYRRGFQFKRPGDITDISGYDQSLPRAQPQPAQPVGGIQGQPVTVMSAPQISPANPTPSQVVSEPTLPIRTREVPEQIPPTSQATQAQVTEVQPVAQPTVQPTVQQTQPAAQQIIREVQYQPVGSNSVNAEQPTTEPTTPAGPPAEIQPDETYESIYKYLAETFADILRKNDVKHLANVIDTTGQVVVDADNIVELVSDILNCDPYIIKITYKEKSGGGCFASSKFQLIKPIVSVALVVDNQEYDFKTFWPKEYEFLHDELHISFEKCTVKCELCP